MDTGLDAQRRRPSVVGGVGNFLARAQWALVPLVVFGLLELRAQRWLRDHECETTFWAWKERTIRPEPPPSIFFVGSSRVAAAIDEQAFEGVVASHFGRPVQTVNYGAGYSVMAQHYLNLRNRVREHPEEMRGGVVFIEAYCGLPEPTSWEGRWFHEVGPQLLLPVLRSDDYLGLWNSTMTREERWHVVCEVLARQSALLHARQKLGEGVFKMGKALVSQVLVRFCPPPPPVAVAEADLRSAGGIRTDADAVEKAKQLAVKLAQQEPSAEEAPPLVWDRTVVADLVRLVQAAGGQVVFFEMPLHSMQSAGYRAAAETSDQQTFRALTRAWRTPYLQPDFVAHDEDFPDYWHLRKSRSQEFAVKLADAWLKATSSGG
jgi:hypothetical protein